ncbi:MAG: response regulator transcription factor [Jatrophihabitans sp.]|uniref:response regulator transcription factor n=1 Tax=Jatrophihabitans sp. TaxID=1932789 RepID=UPI00390DB79A
MSEPLDVVVADGHTLFVDALATVLRQRGHRVRFTASTRDGMVQGVSAFRPEACVTDNRYPDGEAVDVIERLARISPATKIVLLTADADAETLRRALAAGAAGYVHKSWGLGVLLDAVQRVLAGEVVVQGAIAPARPAAAAQPDLLRLAAYLTRRELECLAHLAAGLDTAAMARRLGVSQTTVRSHVQSVLSKLGVHSRLEAASLATRFGLVDASLGRPSATGTWGPRDPRRGGGSGRWR